ncbi:MAG TPA: rRNA maturation RNase YbeY [Longimicrobiaceae bacterium]|nr:rRNA maturation RNase YbeY [Longimicrobiaceae bacterium]
MAREVEASVAEGLELPIAPVELEGVMRAVLEAEGVEDAELSLALLRDAEIAALNEEYLQHEGPTDVISFPLHAAGAVPLGDVYVGAEQAARQAAELGVPLREELLRLAVHGTLHVLGYDHPAGAEREECPMYARQEELLRGWLAR